MWCKVQQSPSQKYPFGSAHDTGQLNTFQMSCA